MRAFEGDTPQEPTVEHVVERILAGAEPVPDEARIRMLWANVARRAGLEGTSTTGASFDVLHRRGQDQLRTLLAGVFKRHTLRQRRNSSLAGVLLGVTTLIVGWYAATTGLKAHKQTAVSTFVTGNGQRATITLPDGNTVALNVASRLDVPADYMTGNHTVHCTGEALFTISHHLGAPFTVMTGTTTARVLGTSFSVRHYASDTTARVAVRDGKVMIGSVVLTTGQSVNVGRHGVTRMSVADPAEFSFATGTLILHRSRLSDVIPVLDRWYDADIRLGDAGLGEQEINGRFGAGSLSDLESILGLIFNARIERDGRVLTLFAR